MLMVRLSQFMKLFIELNGNITETFPQNTDSVMLARHEELADNSIKQRNDILVNIVKIISEILKF